MAVMIGSARIDEHGHAKGGSAGDQNGKEVSRQAWYKHSKGWRVFRAKNPAQAERIAQDMEYACDNKHIGYDQGQRLTLYTVSKPLGFDCSKVKTNCETDCSALVRVCCAYAGIDLPNFRTTTEASALLKSGAFEELTGKEYTDSSARLRRGDILVTKTQGHTVVVLSNGSKAEVAPVPEYHLGDRELRKGDNGQDVHELQEALAKLGWVFPQFGVDGDFGVETEANVKGFQASAGLEPTGICDAQTAEALKAALGGHVEIMGKLVNVRAGAGKTASILGTVRMGDKLPYAGITTDEGWHRVLYGKGFGWVSGKYSKVVD